MLKWVSRQKRHCVLLLNNIDVRRLARPTEAGCQTIIASGYLVTFYVKPDVKKHKNRIRQLAGPIHLFLKNIVSIFSFYSTSPRSFFVLSFTRPFWPGYYYLTRQLAGQEKFIINIYSLLFVSLNTPPQKFQKKHGCPSDEVRRISRGVFYQHLVFYLFSTTCRRQRIFSFPQKQVWTFPLNHVCRVSKVSLQAVFH